MRIFFLDDNPVRRQRFASVHSACDIVFAQTAQEAIDVLSKDTNFDQIYLDHDLGNDTFVDSDLENTGYQVAKFLSDKDVRGEIIIHSFNAVGAKRMLQVLPQAVYQPFNV